MNKRIALFYGVICYVSGVLVFVYFIGFLNNAAVPVSVDSGSSDSLLPALLIDALLVVMFGLQHSVMARETFKNRWTKLVPKPLERSTYVLVTAAVLALLMVLWQPLPQHVWNVTFQPARVVLWGLNGLGWLFTLVSTRLISSDHLFGLQQVKEHARGVRPQPPRFQTPLFYRFVRHPMMFGFLVAFWVTPEMSIGRMTFAGLITAYILIGIRLEETDLIQAFGNQYERYRQNVAMLLPGLKRKTPYGTDSGERIDERRQT